MCFSIIALPSVPIHDRTTTWLPTSVLAHCFSPSSLSRPEIKATWPCSMPRERKSFPQRTHRRFGSESKILVDRLAALLQLVVPVDPRHTTPQQRITLRITLRVSPSCLAWNQDVNLPTGERCTILSLSFSGKSSERTGRIV